MVLEIVLSEPERMYCGAHNSKKMNSIMPSNFVAPPDDTCTCTRWMRVTAWGIASNGVGADAMGECLNTPPPLYALPAPAVV